MTSAARVSWAWPKLAACVAHPLEPVGRDVEQPGLPRVRHRGEHDQVAQPVQQVGGEPPGVVAALDDPVHGPEHRGPVPGRERVGDLVQQALVGVAEQRDGPLVGQPFVAGAGQQLVQDRTASRARSPAPARITTGSTRGLVLDALAGQDLLQQLRAGRRAPSAGTGSGASGTGSSG